MPPTYNGSTSNNSNSSSARSSSENARFDANMGLVERARVPVERDPSGQIVTSSQRANKRTGKVVVVHNHIKKSTK